MCASGTAIQRQNWDQDFKFQGISAGNTNLRPRIYIDALQDGLRLPNVKDSEDGSRSTFIRNS